MVGPFTLLIPVIGIASAWLVLNEAPSMPELVGGGLLLTGVATAVLRFGRSTKLTVGTTEAAKLVPEEMKPEPRQETEPRREATQAEGVLR